MTGNLKQIEQALAALNEELNHLGDRFNSAYEAYFQELGSAVKQQLILASYHLCTQSYPKQFLELSVTERQKTQDELRQVAAKAEALFHEYLDSDAEEESTSETEHSDHTPAMLLPELMMSGRSLTVSDSTISDSAEATPSDTTTTDAGCPVNSDADSGSNSGSDMGSESVSSLSVGSLVDNDRLASDPVIAPAPPDPQDATKSLPAAMLPETNDSSDFTKAAKSDTPTAAETSETAANEDVTAEEATDEETTEDSDASISIAEIKAALDAMKQDAMKRLNAARKAALLKQQHRPNADSGDGSRPRSPFDRQSHDHNNDNNENNDSDEESEDTPLMSEEDIQKAMIVALNFLEAAEEDEVDLSSDDEPTPDNLLAWQRSVERDIVRILAKISHQANRLLYQHKILPQNLPLPILEIASQADSAGEMMAGSPNLIKLVVEAEGKSEKKKSKPIRVMAISLRLSEVEFSMAAVSQHRHTLRKLMAELSGLRRKYQKVQREYAIAQAQAAWRSTWFEN